MRRSSLWAPEQMPPVLFTRAAVLSFAALAGVERSGALRLLVRAARRARLVREPAVPVHDLGELRPEEIPVALLVRRLPGLEPLVCVWVAPRRRDGPGGQGDRPQAGEMRGMARTLPG